MLDHRRFDTDRRALVAGLVSDIADIDRLVSEGADVLAVTETLDAGSVRDRVEVPVATATPGSIRTDDDARHDSVGPFHDLPVGERLGAFAAAALGGASVLVTTEVRAVRRVAEVAARIRVAETAR